MADFSDLWNTSTPSNSSNATLKPTRSATNPALGAKSAPKNDVFALLASSASSGRPTANYHGSSGPPSRSLTPSINNAKPAPTSSSDAFSSLFDLGGSAQSKSLNGLSIAERQAKAEEERREKLRREQETMRAQGAFWDKFEGPSSSASGNAKKALVNNDAMDDLFDFGAPAASSSIKASSAAPSLLTPTSLKPSPAAQNTNNRSTTPNAPPKSKPAVNVWDFDLLATPDDKPPSAIDHEAEDDLFAGFDHLASKRAGPPPVRKSPSPSGDPGDFDFGDGESGRPRKGREDADDEDDILGLLGQPARPAQKELTPSPRPHLQPLPETRPSPRTSPRPSTRSTSPPPHILGQIVEMGFSVQQAKVALAATDTGMNVEGALEILLNQGGAGEEETQTRGTGRQARSPLGEEAHERDTERERAEARRRRRAGPSRNEVADDGRSNGERGARRGDEAVTGEENQADKILAQASEIGLNVLSRATAFWQSSKEIAAKVIEEQRSQTVTPTGGTGARRVDGRPKWMVDQAALDGHEEGKGSLAGKRQERAEKTSGFRDDDDLREQNFEQRPKPSRTNSRPVTKAVEDPAPAPRTEQRAGSLFAAFGLGESSPSPSPSTPYVSPNRRKGRPQEPTPSAPAAVAPRPPKPRRQRTLVPCPPPTLAAATNYRTKAASEYKLGQFAAADTSFTSAIDRLPEGHYGLVPLWNNRAQARLKIGSHAGAVEDCTYVVQLIGMDYKETDEEPISSAEKDGPGVNLGEALVKAYSRRAAAYEMGEKWDKAKEDWEKLVSDGPNYGTAGVRARGEALRGLERCKKMLGVVGSGGKDASSSPRASKPKPRAPPSRPAPPSEAAKRLKAANAAAEAEENERYAFKDSVDARLQAWKGGKETNIRALIASLETVLWPELGWVKVSIAELVTAQQVKVRYMKAIAKLHPDKVRNATVEQKMIANGVFGALNEAYNVFKP